MRTVSPVGLCSFCCGSAQNNRQGQPEQLISCADCGNSGHPSCLKFSSALTEAVKNTHWQCLDCKSCTVCGGTGQESNMLCCDGCDRGCHMQCCNPPFSTIPHDSWLCCLCQKSACVSRRLKDFSTSMRAQVDVTQINSGGCPVTLATSLVTVCRPLGLIDDLTRFFIPTNKRRTCVSSKATIDAKISCQSDDVAQRHLVPKPRNCFVNRLRSQQLMSKRIKTFYDGLTKLYEADSLGQNGNKSVVCNVPRPAIHTAPRSAVRHIPRSLARSAAYSASRSAVCTAPRSALKMAIGQKSRRHRLSQTELLRDGLSEYFRVSHYRRDSNTDNQLTKFTHRRQHFRKRAQVESLFDGLSTFFSVNSEHGRRRFGSTLSMSGLEKMKRYKTVGQLKGLCDGLSHLYTAASGQRQRKSPFFYSTTRRQSRSQHHQLLASSSSVAATTSTDDDSKTPITTNNKLRRLTADMCCSQQAAGCDDVNLFTQAHDHAEKLTKPASSVRHQPSCIELGRYEITSWYSSPYRPDFARLFKLFICRLCLKCFKTRETLVSHMAKCLVFYPPGNEVYRDGSLSVYEVDGDINREYCQNLCLLAKLFLDHKTLYYDVEPFLFYVLAENDKNGSQLIGYFSKEKYCQQKYNLSCIMILPPYQRRGYGRFLIDFSYLLSRLEAQPGSPEKPLSDLGRVTYMAYWKHVLFDYLCKKKMTASSQLSIHDICMDTGMTADDVISMLCNLDMLNQVDSRNTLTLRCQQVARHEELKEESWIRVKYDCLHWKPSHSSS